jgi:hypothetical protein
LIEVLYEAELLGILYDSYTTDSFQPRNNGAKDVSTIQLTLQMKKTPSAWERHLSNLK